MHGDFGRQGLRGSWVVLSRFISRTPIVLTYTGGLIIPLITANDTYSYNYFRGLITPLSNFPRTSKQGTCTIPCSS